MHLNDMVGCHLTYCTNIHPGESWQEVFTQLKENVPEIKKTISPDRDFGIGLRLSALAVSELLQGDHLPRFKDWLTQSALYVFTINGFPYGRFHGSEVKENVYLPDWSAPRRTDYSRQLAVALEKLLPKECIGTISTVPIGLKSNFNDRKQLLCARDNLLAMAGFLMKQHRETGKHIQLALEPEPGCYLEKSADIISFFHDWLLTGEAMERLRSNLSLSDPPAPEELLQYLGVCLDTCHTAVMHEPPLDMAESLAANDIGIFKVQLTAALELRDIDPESLAALPQLSDPVYLHQTTVTDPEGRRSFYLDLPQALEQVRPRDNLRIHYHVPVYLEKFGMCHTSRRELQDFLSSSIRRFSCHHFEVETYTFDLLSGISPQSSAVDNISRELRWVKKQLENENTNGLDTRQSI